MKAAICLRSGREYKTITVDSEGSPAYTGAILYAKYQDIKRVERLMKLGDLFELHENIKPVPNLGHYILKDGSRVIEVRLQEGVCISKSRDIRQMEGSVIKKNRPILPRVYENPEMAYICEGADFVYVFDDKDSTWNTWGLDFKTKNFGKIKVNYKLYIENLICRDVLSDLTPTEKEKLKK